MFVSRLSALSKKTSIKTLNNIKKFHIVQQQDFSTTNIPQNSSFKDDSSHQNGFSLFNLRKTLKLSGVEFTEGPTNIKLECPVCFRGCGSKESDSIFINKTTGKVIYRS